MRFQVKQLNTNDVPLFTMLIHLFHDVFEMESLENTSNTYLQSVLQRPGFLAFVALHENKVIAGLTAHELPMYYSEGTEIFIYDVAVRPRFQRQGVGKMLPTALNEYCRQHNIKETFVAAHEADKHALDFYRSAGGNAEKVVHFNFTTGE